MNPTRNPTNVTACANHDETGEVRCCELRTRRRRRRFARLDSPQRSPRWSVLSTGRSSCSEHPCERGDRGDGSLPCFSLRRELNVRLSTYYFSRLHGGRARLCRSSTFRERFCCLCLVLPRRRALVRLLALLRETLSSLASFTTSPHSVVNCPVRNTHV